MVLKIPQHHDFPQTLKEIIFSETGCSLPEWEISVPKTHDLTWSIVLSYLMSTNYKDDKDDFSRRLKTLTGSDKDAKIVNKSIRCFNPFRNRWSCFYDETLKNLVHNFRKQLGWASLSDVSEELLLDAYSEVLQCPILLIRDYSKSENCQIFKKNVGTGQSLIVLIESSFEDVDNSKLTVTVRNFMIDDISGQRMKKAALRYYLKETGIPKKVIVMVTSVVDKEESFIKSVLRSGLKNVILDVYKSPYIVSKLSEAGYEMDPKSKDTNGFSGLFYALEIDDSAILCELYYFAVDDCSSDEVSFRNPDSNIMSNLQRIKDILLEDMAKLKGSNCHQQYTDIERRFEKLLRLNKFLTKLNENILEIKNRLNNCKSILVFEASKRRDVIVSLLDTYKKFFTYQDSSSLSPLDDYISHSEYYLSVDIVAAKIFFDNIFLLKERLKLENDKQFSEIESSFFFFTIYYLDGKEPKLIKTIKTALFSHETMHIFPLIYRGDNFNKLNNFRKLLHETVINQDNVVNHIPKSEIYSILHFHPDTKNVLEMTRFIKYITNSKRIRVKDAKSVLAVERILQVIGEYTAPEKKDIFSFKRILYLCLPNELAQLLRRLRHVLTHLKGHAFPSKIECEKNVSLFWSILNEIDKMEKYFRPAYSIINLSFKVHLISQFEKDLQRINDSGQLYSHLPFFKEELVVKNDDNRRRFLHTVKLSCHTYLKDALKNIEDEIRKEYCNTYSNIDDLKHSIIYLLRPLQWLLELFKKCKMDCVVTPLNTFKELESSQNDSLDALIKKTATFIEDCYDLLPMFNVIEKQDRSFALKSVEHIDYFMAILKGVIYLSNEVKDEIRKEIPERIKQQVSMKNKLIRSIEEGSPLKVDVNSAEFELTYLPRTKMRDLRNLYESNDSYVLTVLKTQDPIAELEEIFTKNSVDKKRYDALCDTMQFSDKTRKNLGKLVAGQRKKLPANNLENLFNRIQLLKTIIIDDDEEIQKLWVKIKRGESQQLIDEKIVRRYLKDFQFRAAVEMLLFDCMILFEGEKGSEKMFTKSSKLYRGINMRNIISHGNPLVEKLCLSLDPQELPSEIVKEILILIKSEDAVKSILELYESVNNDFTKLSKVMYCDENDEYCELRGRIKLCNEWEYYALLLPRTHGVQIT